MPSDKGSQPQLLLHQKALLWLLALALLYTIYFARRLLLPISLAFFFAILLRPLVSLLKRLRIPDAIGAAIVVILLIALLATAFYRLSAPAADWIARGPNMRGEVEKKLGVVRETIKGAQETTEQLEEITKMEDAENEVVVKGPSLAEQILSATQITLAMGIVVIALLYFLLARGQRTLDHLSDGFHDSQKRDRWQVIGLQIESQIGRYIRTVTVINLILGTLTGVALWLVGVPNPALWGIFTALANFIPYLGPAATFGVLSIVSLLTFDSWLRILLPPLVFIVLATLEGEFITPTVLGKQLLINPIIVFLGILFWGWIWGIPGVLLAVPILTVLNIVLKNIPELSHLGRLFD